MEDFERWELFYQGGQRTGVLYRKLSVNVLLTRVCYGQAPSEYRAESRIRLSDDQSDWELSWFRNTAMGEPFLMLRGRETPENSMPGYGEFLMLRRLLETGVPNLEFVRLGDEGRGREASGAAVGHRTRLELAPGTDRLRIGQREAIDCRRIDVHSSGRVVVRHWVHEGRVVASDWGAARSYRVSGGGAEAAWLSLEGLNEGSVRFMTHGFDG